MTEGGERMHTLTPNAPRIVAALYQAMVMATSKNRSPSQYDLVKTLFLADREHLNVWGRPITYDNYKAMKHGPVPSLAYDLLKGNEKAKRDHRITTLPWTSQLEVNGGRKRIFTPKPNALKVEEWLSESDMEALSDSLTTVLSLGFSQIRRLTHEDPAYLEAWRDDGEKAAYDMKLGLLFEEPNFEHAELLAEQSSYV